MRHQGRKTKLGVVRQQVSHAREWNKQPPVGGELEVPGGEMPPLRAGVSVGWGRGARSQPGPSPRLVRGLPAAWVESRWDLAAPVQGLLPQGVSLCPSGGAESPRRGRLAQKASHIPCLPVGGAGRALPQNWELGAGSRTARDPPCTSPWLADHVRLCLPLSLSLSPPLCHAHTCGSCQPREQVS